MALGGNVSRKLRRSTLYALVSLLLWVTVTSASGGMTRATSTAAGMSFGRVVSVLTGTFTVLGVLFVFASTRR